MRYRVLPVASAAAATTVAATSAAAPASTTPSAPRTRVRIGLRGLTVRPDNASGHDWDVVGGGPDVYVLVYSVPGQRELSRTPVTADSVELTFGSFLPGVYAPEHLPLRFVVMDEDATTDELIGSAELDLAELPVRAGEITLPVVSEGASAVQTGTLRLRIEPLR